MPRRHENAHMTNKEPNVQKMGMVSQYSSSENRTYDSQLIFYHRILWPTPTFQWPVPGDK